MSEIKEIESGCFSSVPKYAGKQFSKKRITESFEIELFEQDFYHTVINDKRVPYRKDTVVIAKPGDTRHSRLHFTCRYIHVNFEEGPLKEFFSDADNLIYVTDIEEYKKTFEAVAVLFSEGKNDFEMISLLYHLAAMLKRDSMDKTPKPVFTDKRGKTQIGKPYISILTKYMETEYSEKITLKTLAARVNLHPNYVHRIFRKAYGRTPLEYLNSIRLNHARFCLLNSDDAISDIAFACGFNSQTYFSASFEKAFGVSPLTYRKENREKM